MFDIFDEKPQPKLYIADIHIGVITRKKTKKQVLTSVINIISRNTSIVLLDNNFPTKKSENIFFKKIFDKYIDKGDINNVSFKIEKMDNIKFSSNLSYKFNYNEH